MAKHSWHDVGAFQVWVGRLEGADRARESLDQLGPAVDRQLPRVPPAWPGVFRLGVDVFGSQSVISGSGSPVSVAGLAGCHISNAWVLESPAPGVQPLA